MHTLYLAWRYLRFHPGRTATLVACITLIAALPLALETLLGEAEQQLLSRAEVTPLVIGAKGSAMDLAMNTLYFDDEVPELVTMAVTNQVSDTGLADPVPLHVRFEARGFPLVGTNLDYFDLRNLEIARGRMLATLGECVLGAEVAAQLSLEPGQSLISSPETLFDLAGVYPLKMNIVGILQRAHTVDDRAVFVDLKTAWVIEGLGHGHQDLTQTADQSVVLERTQRNVVANAKLLQYNEISAANINSFHFHGAADEYPITAVIAVPRDVKSGTILRGRYLESAGTEQIIRPKEVIDGLLANIFRIKNVLDAVIIIVGFATVLAIVLVFSLSVRLRERELDTVFKLGGRRMMVARLLGAEMLIIVVMSAVLCTGILAGVNGYSTELVRSLFMG